MPLIIMETKTNSSLFYQAYYQINSWCNYDTTESAHILRVQMYLIIKMPLIRTK